MTELIAFMGQIIIVLILGAVIGALLLGLIVIVIAVCRGFADGIEKTHDNGQREGKNDEKE